MTTVGIEKIGVYPCSLALRMPDLCAARGHDPDEIRDVMMIDERSINPLWEDPVTMGVQAAKLVLTPENRDRIELLIVASESGVDQEKPMSSWIHRYLDLKPQCRNFEIKHACYGGTAALKMAAGWIASGMAGDAKALIVTTDQSRMHLGKPWEYVMGAGAAAILVSNRPQIVELELGKHGYWAYEVSDLTRPTSTVETGNSETSLVSYMEALEGAYAHFVRNAQPDADFDTYFKKSIYHAPFGGMTYRAHRALLQQWKPMPRKDAWKHFEARSLPALKFIRRMGGTYSSSTFIGLLAMLSEANDVEAGDRLSLFSYGSGSCAEFYSVKAGAHARSTARSANLEQLLNSRRYITVDEYEALEKERTRLVDCGNYAPPTEQLTDWYDEFYRGKGFLVFLGMRDYYRHYGWS